MQHSTAAVLVGQRIIMEIVFKLDQVSVLCFNAIATQWVHKGEPFLNTNSAFD